MEELLKRGISEVGTWKFRGRKGITLGDPTKNFPYAVGPQYPVDTTESNDPELTDEEVLTIRRRFEGCPLIDPPLA